MASARPPFTVTAAGVVLDPRGAGQSNFFELGGDDSDFFLGISGAYTNLTLTISGSRTGAVYYDVASYTTDNVGPLVGPLSPGDGTSVAYIADVRAFTRVQVVILTLTGTLTLEVLKAGFFTSRGSAGDGVALQSLLALRNIQSILSGWLGFAAGQLPKLPPAMTGTGVGGTFQ